MSRARITVTVSPGARRSEIVGRHGDGWKVRVAAPPDRGRANEAVVELVADALRVGRERVHVAAGHTSRRKLVEVEEMDAVELGRRLDAAARSS